MSSPIITIPAVRVYMNDVNVRKMDPLQDVRISSTCNSGGFYYQQHTLGILPTCYLGGVDGIPRKNARGDNRNPNKRHCSNVPVKLCLWDIWKTPHPGAEKQKQALHA